MTPERQAEIEALGSLSNEVQNNPNAIFKFVCEAKRGIRELLIELQQARQRAEAAEAALTLLDGYAAARLADPYNDKLTFAVWLQSRK